MLQIGDAGYGIADYWAKAMLSAIALIAGSSEG
jgi:hypothetical protein